MTRKLVLPLIAAIAVAAVPQGAPAQQVHAKQAKFLSSIERQNDGKKATIKVRYTCKAAEGVWVSVKQTKSGKKDAKLEKEGSSKTAATWLHSHRNKFTCDGTAHTKRFTVDKVERGAKGRLVKGVAYVQFCVTKGRDLVISKTAWLAVE